MPLVLALFSLTAAFATSFYSQPFEQTIGESPIIIRGVVGKSEVKFFTDPKGLKGLFTYTEVQVKERLKGEGSFPSVIRVRELGGEKDGVEMGVSGRAEFSMGEDVVLLLNPKTSDDSYPLKGLMMGKLVVEKDRRGNETLKGAAIGIANSTHGHEGETHEAEKAKEWSMKSLRSLIREQARAPTSTPSSPPVPIEFVATAAPGAQPSVVANVQTGDNTDSTQVLHPENDLGVLKRSLKFLAAILLGGIFYVWKRRNRR